MVTICLLPFAMSFVVADQVIMKDGTVYKGKILVDTDKAIRFIEDYRNILHDLLAPDIFPVEIAHALTKAERQNRIKPKASWQAWLYVMGDAPQLIPWSSLMPRAFAISSKMRIGIYDCLYVALAEQEKCKLITADEKLIKTLQRQFPFILPLSSLP